MSTLCSCERVGIKEKPGTLCEETVDAVDSLWTRVEIKDDVPPLSQFWCTVFVGEASTNPHHAATG
jgi:hypothetical protein